MNIGENLWHDIVEKLKKEFSETTVGLWFGSATLSSLDGDSVTIIAEDDFKKSIIEKKYLPVLERMFEEVLGFKVEVRIESAAGDSDARSEERLFITSAPPARPTPSAQPASPSGPNSRSEYTFDNFVVGSSNQLAQAAAFAVAQHPAELYNPLFLFGPSGLGKTHLLFAIMNEVKKLHPNFNILYVTSEEFTNELIDALALRQNRNMAFKEKYRNVDMLLVDDVHFIAGKYSVQEEFFHTFNALYNERKQIILTSDRPPRDISYLESRLQTRFESGLMADIQPAGHRATRCHFQDENQAAGYPAGQRGHHLPVGKHHQQRPSDRGRTQAAARAELHHRRADFQGNGRRCAQGLFFLRRQRACHKRKNIFLCFAPLRLFH